MADSEWFTPLYRGKIKEDDMLELDTYTQTTQRVWQLLAACSGGNIGNNHQALTHTHTRPDTDRQTDTHTLAHTHTLACGRAYTLACTGVEGVGAFEASRLPPAQRAKE